MNEQKGPRKDRWYLALMSPNTKGPQFAWLDPTSIYINSAAFGDLLDDLTSELDGDGIDVVAGIDAMGFVLAAAIASRLNRGFLPIRKAGKLCVETDIVTFTNYSRRTQELEMRIPAFDAGTRVLLVDQWVETGGTMDGAIRLVERQGERLPAWWQSRSRTTRKRPSCEKRTLVSPPCCPEPAGRCNATGRNWTVSPPTRAK